MKKLSKFDKEQEVKDALNTEPEKKAQKRLDEISEDVASWLIQELEERKSEILQVAPDEVADVTEIDNLCEIAGIRDSYDWWQLVSAKVKITLDKPQDKVNEALPTGLI